ncbi:MAG TPA: extracellular solute-binding protein [Anaerolineaceae bacterium]|nr:extracellular solute-binding protein [Anaerolineaceae bacterium]
MKRYSFFVLLVIASMLLAACGTSTPTPEATQAPADDQTAVETEAPAETEAPEATQAAEEPAAAGAKITFMTPPWGVPPEEGLKEFEAASGISVEILSLSMDQIYSKVQVAASAQQAAADVIFLSEESPSFIVTPGFVMPLDDIIANDADLDMADIADTDFWKIDGKTYGIPSYIQTVMMDYNADKLAQAGYENPPATWDELTTMAKKLKADGIDEYPISMGAIDWSWYMIALTKGDKMFDEDLNPVFADEGSKGREAMALLLSYFKDELISPAMLSETTPHSVFMSGVGTFHQSWLGANGLMNNAEQSKQAPNVKYMALPETSNTWSMDAALGISAYTENQDAAWQFIKWYIGESNERGIFDAYGLYPASQSLQKALDSEGKLVQFDVTSEQASHLNQLPRWAGWWGPWTTKVTEALRRGINGELTSDQVIDQVATDWNDLKAEYQQ